MMKRTLWLLVALVVLGTSCETSKPERTESTQPPSEPHALGEGETSRLIARAEKLRDRAFETEPTLEPVASADALPQPAPLADAVASERQLLLTHLFGAATAEATSASTAPPFSAIARYDSAENRVVYVRGHQNAEELEAAILTALVEGIDAQQFAAMPEPSSWDQYLAHSASQNATVSLALADHLLEEHHPNTELSLLTRRPELASELPVLGDWLVSATSAAGLEERVRARERAFSLREGWTLAAAMFRSNGWSGVELVRLMAPKRSSDIVRPDQWMAGESVGTWTWPDDDEAARAGLVGPSIAAIWLEDVVGPHLARTVYAGYISDAYRVFEASSDDRARFEWLSLWNAPGSARQVARAFEKRLRKRFDGQQNPEAHFVVFQKGLKVGVIISEDADDKKRERAQHLLENHSVKLEPREGLPTSFVPTRRDELVATMQKATLEERVWRDPATGLELDLSVLGDGWKVQQPDHGPVRWFAQNAVGSLLQLTVELDNPLGPAFASDAYHKQLVEALQATVKQAKLESVAPTDKTPSRGLVVRISGEIDKTARVLQLWHFQRDDLIISYSLQATPKAFSEHKELAASILDDARTLEAAPTEGEQEKPKGTIEYEVEDE